MWGSLTLAQLIQCSPIVSPLYSYVTKCYDISKCLLAPPFSTPSYRYGSGFTLQAKVKLGAPPPSLSKETSRFSLRRQGSRDGGVPPSPRTPSRTPISPGPPDVSLHGGGFATSFNAFDTTSLHIFVREAFPGATVLEEHQVGMCPYNLYHSRCGTPAVPYRMLFNQTVKNNYSGQCPA